MAYLAKYRLSNALDVNESANPTTRRSHQTDAAKEVHAPWHTSAHPPAAGYSVKLFSRQIRTSNEPPDVSGRPYGTDQGQNVHLIDRTNDTRLVHSSKRRIPMFERGNEAGTKATAKLAATGATSTGASSSCPQSTGPKTISITSK